MKILLISANTVTAPYPVYPLGLDYVAAAIGPGHEVRFCDMNVTDAPGLIGQIKDFTPEVIGLSLRNVDNTDTSHAEGFIGRYRDIVRAVRGATDAVLVAGGSGFTIFPEEMMAALEPDYGIIGEGERFALFLEALTSGRDPSALPGVIVPGARADVPAPWGERFPRFFDHGNPHIAYYLKRGGMLNLQTKRGCSFRCIYCTYPHIEGSRLRLIPPAEVAATAVSLQEAGARYLFLTDSAFNCHPEHSMEVAQAFIDSGLSIPWGAFFAPVNPPGGYFELMRRAGATHVEFGTESLSDTMLAAYRKPFTAEDVRLAHGAANRAGLHTAHYLLLGGPGESEKTLAETLDNAARLERTVLFFFCGIRIYPHTELYDIAVNEKQISPDASILEPVFYQSRLISPQQIIATVTERARGRDNWVIGAGGEEMNRVISRMYRRGHSGPLWEFLIR